MCPSHPAWLRSLCLLCLSLSTEARLIALEDRVRQTEEVLVAEHLAEAAQQTVGPQPASAGWWWRETSWTAEPCRHEGDWKTPAFGGDVDVNGLPGGIR